ncbi:MAG TPA: S8 family serine peptidase, partial [Anaerolineae bacterium]|nr:S8 family serine peptidase [Anaerolineae bacterium]
IQGNRAYLSGGGLVLTGGSDLYVDNGAVIDNVASSYGGGIWASGTGTVVDFDTFTASTTCVREKCAQLSNNSALGLHGGGIYADDRVIVDLEAVYMEGNGAFFGSGVYAVGGNTRINMDSVMLVDGEATNYILSVYDPGIGTPELTINSSTIAGNSGQTSLWQVSGGGTFDGFGLIVAENDGGNWYDGGGVVMMDCSVLSMSYVGNGNVVADPLFVDSANGRYHISKNSPAIDMCNSGFTIDIDRESRPRDVADQGAFDGTSFYVNGRGDVAQATEAVRLRADVGLGMVMGVTVDVVWAEQYGDALWVGLTAEQKAKLAASGLPYQNVAGYGEIAFDRFRFDPVVDGEPWGQLGAAAGAVMTDEGYGLYFVQLSGPATDEDMEDLGVTVELLQYYPQGSYLVWGTAADIERWQEISPKARWAGVYHVGYRLTTRTVNALMTEAGEKVSRWQILMVDDGRLGELERLVTANGGRIMARGGQTALGEGVGLAHWEVVMPVAGVRAVAAWPSVMVVEVMDLPQAGDESSNQIIADNAPGGVPQIGYQNWLATVGYDGSGVRVAIMDSGVDWDHPDLNVASGSEYGGYAEAGEPGSDGGGGPDSGHGTHVAGIVAGTGVSGADDANGFLYGLGVAPGATLHAQDILDSWPGVNVAVADAATYAEVSNNSWGWGIGYNTQSVGYAFNTYLLDEYTLDSTSQGAAPRSPFTHIFLAGNNGDDCGSPPCVRTFWEPAEGKNLLTVGSTDSYRNGEIDNISPFSSRGLAADGRIKPDVMAPGNLIVSTENGDGVNTKCTISPSGELQHAYCNGTSMATPHVTGMAALFVQKWLAEGVGTAVPEPATIKAAIIATTDDLGGVDNGYGTPITARPNGDQGWGRVNLSRLLAPPVTVQYYENPMLLSGTGMMWETTVAVYDTNEPLRITLSWSDQPGASNNPQPALVNDLDLEVVGPGGVTWVGNDFAADGWTVDGGSVAGNDSLNTVENVWLEVPAAGVYTIRVQGAAINGNGYYYNGDATDQHFSLACYNCEQIVAGTYDAGADELYAQVGIDGDFCEYGSIGDALAAVGSGGTVYVPGGIYTGSLGIINKDVTLVAATNNCAEVDAGAEVIVTGGGNVATFGGVMQVGAGEVVTLTHMTVMSGVADYGGVVYVGGSGRLVLEGTTIGDGRANSLGGGIRV